MNPHNYYTIFTRKSKSQKLVILSETQCSEVSKSHESNYYQINAPKANPKDNDSPKVSDSLSIHNSPKWILRLFQRLSMTTLLFFTIPSANLSNLHAIDLDSALPNCQSGTTQDACYVKAIYGEVTNSGNFRLGVWSDSIMLDNGGGIDTFINYGTITNNGDNKYTLYWGGGYVRNVINYGTMGGIGGNRGGAGQYTPVSVTNYGRMKGVDTGWGDADITIDNYGVMDTVWTGWTEYHFSGNAGYSFILKNYALIIGQSADSFNNLNTKPTDNSHLIFRNGNIRFQDESSKMILDFGNNFEFGKEYALGMLIIDTSYNNSKPNTALNVDFSRLTTRSELYTLTQSGNNFIVNLADSKTAGYSMVGSLHKSNIKTMNNLYLQSNNMIYPHKYKRKKSNATNPNTNPRNNNYRRVRGISSLFMNPHNIYVNNDFVDSLDLQNSSYLQGKSYLSLQNSTSTRHSELSLESEESTNLNKRLDSNLDSFALDSSLIAFAQNDGKSVVNPNNNTLDSSLNESTLADLNQSNYYANLPIQSNELFFYDNEWLLARDNANARKVNMDYTHSVKAVNNSNVSKDAYYNKGAYRNKIITNDTRTNEINQYQSTNRQGNVSRTPNQNNRHLANQSNNSPCGSYKCIYIYKPQQQTQTKQIQPQPKVEPKPIPKVEPKIEPKVVEQPKIEPKIQPQPKPIQVIRPTMPPPPKVEPKIEPKPIVQPKEQPKVMPKIEPKPEPKVVKVESKPTPPKPKVIIQDPYYFILTPYIAHNFFYEAGRYNLSGLEYGFITAFSGKITEEHILGLHFAFSYGSLKDSVDSIFNITSMNIMGGLNYKFDITTDMYLKARVDIFYFLNQVQSTMTSGNIMKPNNLGFGASVAYGKEWDFDKNGILGLEVALDYKGLMSPNILTQNGGDSTINESFNKALYNMLYVDLGLNYDKYFESSVGKWGLDTGLGVKVNATANALAKSTIRLNNIRDIDMVLDNDMFLAYLNIGGSYLLESKDFDMEFSLAYYGNFGDRSMSNAGGFEWRVYW